MTTPTLVPVVRKFNKDRRFKVDVLYDDDRFIVRRATTKSELGGIYFKPNWSNCGLGDLHNLTQTTPRNMNLIIAFIKFYAKSNCYSVLLYNTSSAQTTIRKALEDNDFHTVKKIFKNNGSKRGMLFHMVQL
ncbi:hypothetical protein LCGC14_0856880 [marine sediment metagenome]|uniref:Uncharacterized protein n=1 Tax=marine sediment metagenome TaxID=412755 RepID=A0A0F9PTX6_9ZZZZ